MPNINAQFKNRKINFAKLADFGFVKEGQTYIYRQKICAEQFELTISITAQAEVFTQLQDLSAGEEYVLHLVPNGSGAFIGKVRQEYDNVLTAVNQNCFENNVFKSKLAQEIIAYVAGKYQNEPEFLWQKFPNNAIFRRTDNQKWYAALLTVKKEKLGLFGNEEVEILDIRATPEEINSLVDGKKYFAGFHMNKQHWLTVCLDGSVALPEILSRLDTSYALAKK